MAAYSLQKQRASFEVFHFLVTRVCCRSSSFSSVQLHQDEVHIFDKVGSYCVENI